MTPVKDTAEHRAKVLFELNVRLDETLIDQHCAH